MKTMKALAAVALLGGVALGQMPGAATPRVQVEKAVKGQDRIIRRSVGAADAYETAVTALATCRAKKVAAEAELVRAGKELEDCTICAPMDGIIPAVIVFHCMLDSRKGAKQWGEFAKCEQEGK